MSDNQPQEFVAPELAELNQLIPSYEFIDFIAKGGMGAVYLARQISLDRQVAIKVLPPILCQNEEFKTSFVTEAKLMAKLNHPNLIGVYDFGDVDGMLYIVMEYVKGQSLFHSAVGKMIEQKTAVEIIKGICEGLEHAHEAGMLHRDVKPANILLNSKAVPKIGDFGLARPSEMTETGTIFGTPGYSAPEVLGAPDRVDKRTDIFSVGVMLYELMTAQLPGDPYTPVQHFAEIDPRFDPIIRKAIDPNIDGRYATSTDLVEALEKVINSPQRTTRLLATSGTSPQIAVGATRANTGASQSGALQYQQPVLKSKSSGGGLLVGIIVVIAMLAGAFVFLNSGSDKDKNQETPDDKVEQESTTKQEADLKKKKRLAREAKNKKNEALRESTPTVIENPLEQLGKVKSQLVEGKRPMEKMPKTIFQLDDDSRILMFIETAMTWAEADRWAEEHGGYISVCSSESDLPIFAKNMDAADAVWLGGGNTVDNKWAWIDGTAWSSSITLPPSKKREFLMLSKEGALKVDSGLKKLPFFVEWRADGTNPGSCEECLKRSNDSLAGGNPSYPIGAFSNGDRRYYIVKHSLSYSAAKNTAAQVGGKLLAMSDSDEFQFVSEMLNKNASELEMFWTAAIKKDELWSWETGETWSQMNWKNDGAGSGSIAVIENGVKPHLSPVDVKNAGEHRLVIEWSKDSENVKQTASDFTLQGMTDLKKIAVTKSNEQRKGVAKQYSSNVSRLVLDLSALRRQLQGRKQANGKEIPDVIKAIENKATVPDDAGKNLKTTKAKEFVEIALKSKARIEAADEKSKMKIRDAYVARLIKIRGEMSEKGQVSMLTHLNKELEQVGKTSKDFDSYIDSLKF